MIPHKDEREYYNQYRARCRQIVKFAGIKYGTIEPTDIDMVVEYRDTYWIWVETKYSERPLTPDDLSTGQALLIERLCRQLDEAGRPTIFIITTHTTPNDEPVDLPLTKVNFYRFAGDWWVPNEDTTLKRLCDTFISQRGSIETL